MKKIFFLASLATIVALALSSCSNEDTYMKSNPKAKGYKFITPKTVMLYDRNDVEVEEREIEISIKIQDDIFLFQGSSVEADPNETMEHIYNFHWTESMEQSAFIDSDGSIADVFRYKGFNNYLRVYGLQLKVDGINGPEELEPFNVLYMLAKIEKVGENELQKEYSITYTLRASPNTLGGEPFELAERVQKVYIIKKINLKDEDDEGDEDDGDDEYKNIIK